MSVYLRSAVMHPLCRLPTPPGGRILRIQEENLHPGRVERKRGGKEKMTALRPLPGDRDSVLVIVPSPIPCHLILHCHRTTTILIYIRDGSGSIRTHTRVSESRETYRWKIETGVKSRQLYLKRVQISRVNVSPVSKKKSTLFSLRLQHSTVSSLRGLLCPSL